MTWHFADFVNTTLVIGKGEKMNYLKPSVFLDTNIIWYDYLRFLSTNRSNVDRWYYEISQPLTFMKCIYEIWGLAKATTPKKIEDRDSEFERQQKEFEKLFLSEFPCLHVGNRVLSKSDSFSLYEVKEYEWLENQYSQHSLLGPRIPPLKNKASKSLMCFDKEYSRFRSDFSRFLKLHSIHVIGYCQVFGKPLQPHIPKESIYFGGLLEHLNVPSEDLEITLAAISSEATFFVSNDRRLIKNWKSIGLNTHFPQPICIDRSGRFSETDIINKWHISNNSDKGWLSKFKSYVTIHRDQFNNASCPCSIKSL